MIPKYFSSTTMATWLIEKFAKKIIWVLFWLVLICCSIFIVTIYWIIPYLLDFRAIIFYFLIGLLSLFTLFYYIYVLGVHFLPISFPAQNSKSDQRGKVDGSASNGAWHIHGGYELIEQPRNTITSSPIYFKAVKQDFHELASILMQHNWPGVEDHQTCAVKVSDIGSNIEELHHHVRTLAENLSVNLANTPLNPLRLVSSFLLLGTSQSTQALTVRRTDEDSTTSTNIHEKLLMLTQLIDRATNIREWVTMLEESTNNLGIATARLAGDESRKLEATYSRFASTNIIGRVLYVNDSFEQARIRDGIFKLTHWFKPIYLRAQVYIDICDENLKELQRTMFGVQQLIRPTAMVWETRNKSPAELQSQIDRMRRLADPAEMERQYSGQC
jgi:hypothetical protein